MIVPILFLFAVDFSFGHVSLTFPPARRLDLDFLDTFRTNKPCGGMPKGDIKTTIPQNSQKLKIEWHLGYGHRGGIKLELLDNNEKPLFDLTPDYVLTSEDDKFKTSYEIDVPEIECVGCSIRLVRQALEWGKSYQFQSCADVDIVKSEDYVEDCLGRGTASGSSCACDKNFFGDRCQFFQDCEDDSDCNSGQCLENPGTAMPKRECYCPAGTFGKNCEKSSEITSNTYNASDYTEILLRGNDVKFLWRYVGNTQETLEGIIIAKTTSYVAIGWRDASVSKDCQRFPENVKPPVTPKQLHLMDCQDIVIGKVRNGLSNIGDYYTRDRSTPRRDDFFSGDDDLESAVGFEVDGTTTIIFRKPTMAQHGSDNSFVNTVQLIYAFGQEGVDFYTEDELKYHSGNRGSRVTYGKTNASSLPALCGTLLLIICCLHLWI